MVGENFPLLSQMVEFQKLTNGAATDSDQLVDHTIRWVRRDAHEFTSVDKIVATLLHQPKESKVQQKYLKERQHVPGIPWLMLGGLSTFDAITSKLKGHSSSVYSVAWSPKGDQVVSGSRDNTVIIWDAATGEQKTQL